MFSISLGQGMGCLGQGWEVGADQRGHNQGVTHRDLLGWHRSSLTWSSLTWSRLTWSSPSGRPRGQQPHTSHTSMPLRTLLPREAPCGSPARARRRQSGVQRKAGMLDVKTLTELTCRNCWNTFFCSDHSVCPNSSEISQKWRFVHRLRWKGLRRSTTNEEYF